VAIYAAAEPPRTKTACGGAANERSPRGFSVSHPVRTD
jgi:hypothetical protein